MGTGVHPIKIHLLRLFYLLMFLFVGYDAWSVILTHKGAWDPMRAAAWCMFASYSMLSIFGVFRPLKMLPLFIFMIVYKSLWLITVAVPLWSAGTLAGSPAEGMAKIFMWVPLTIAIVPWKYAFKTYVLNRTAANS